MASTTYKLITAFSRTGANCKSYLSGIRVQATPDVNDDTSAPGVDEIFVGSDSTETDFTNGYTRNIEIWDQVLSDEKLVEYSS